MSRRPISRDRRVLTLSAVDRLYGRRNGTAAELYRAGRLPGRRIEVSAKQAEELLGMPS